MRLYHPESDSAVAIGPKCPKSGKHTVLMQGFDGGESLEKTSSNGLWMIEKEQVTEGGICTILKAGVACEYRFRHLGTGRFLSALLTEPITGPDGKETSQFALDVESTTREKDSLFNCQSSGLSSNVMTEDATVLLRHASSTMFIHGSEMTPDETDVYPGAIASTPTLGKSPLDEHTLKLEAAEPSEVADFWYLLGCIPMLEAFAQRMTNVGKKNSELNLLKLDENEADPDIQQSAVESVKAQMALAKSSGGGKPNAFDIGASELPFGAIEGKLVADTLEKLIFFVTATESTDAFTCEGLPNQHRQKLMREQGLVEILVDCLRTPFDKEPFAPFDLSVLYQGHFIIEIAQLTYRLLHHMSKDYKRNEFALAPNIDFFVNQACATDDDNDLFAEATLTGLVSNNKTLLEERIGFPQLKLFVDLLLEQDKDARYVKLLAATCSCGTSPISSNQEMLGALILDDESTRETLCIKGCLQSGLPMITFVDYKDGAATSLLQFLDDDDQEQIEYYIAQLGLFSEICFDRNYKGIFTAENLYSYEMILACMQMKSFPYTLRAAFTKLILAVHVDRGPQTVVAVPNLTRTNSHETPSSASNGRDFRDLKAFVIEYLAEMGGQACAWEHDKNEMTLHVLKIVHFLCSAGFYSNVSDVQELINPLVDNLDGTNDLTFERDDPRAMADSDNKLRYAHTEGTVAIMEAKIQM